MRRSAGSGDPASPTTDSDGSDPFSEPDDWELDSTDASASGLASTPPQREDEEWVRDSSPSREASWYTAAGPLSTRPSQEPVVATPEDESVVVVSPLSSTSVGGEGVLVEGVAVEFEKTEEGWEGGGIVEEEPGDGREAGETVRPKTRTSSLAKEGAVVQ